jgi:predicted nucleic acid-binding protein
VRESAVIDANVFLRIIVGDQPHQAEPAKALLRRIADGKSAGVLLPTVVLEIVFILERQYNTSRQRIYDALQLLFQIRNLTVVDRAQMVSGLDDYLHRPGISFADAYHCAMARDFHDGVIVSFDRKLGNVPGVQRREPDEI